MTHVMPTLDLRRVRKSEWTKLSTMCHNIWKIENICRMGIEQGWKFGNSLRFPIFPSQGKNFSYTREEVFGIAKIWKKR